MKIEWRNDCGGWVVVDGKCVVSQGTTDKEQAARVMRFREAMQRYPFDTSENVATIPRNPGRAHA